MPKSASAALLKALTSGDPKAFNHARERVGEPALEAADLSGAALADFDLSHADLTNADLSEADLTGASLDNATLTGADLTGAKLLEIDVSEATFEGASLDQAKLEGTFVDCDFTDTTWDEANVRGVRFIQCKFDGADLDVAALVKHNRFERCTFGDREDLPDEVTIARPAFLQPPMLEGERVVVDKLTLSYGDEAELKREAIGAATGAGWESEMVAVLRDGERIYVGLRPEAGVDVLEEWIAFEIRDGGLEAVELSVDPGFETFLEEVVVPMLEAGRGDLTMRIEQDMDETAVQVTEMVITEGHSKPPRQFKRS